MSNEKVAVLGGGDGAFMMAVDLTDRGYDVHLCEHPSFAEGFEAVQERGAIQASGIGPNGDYPIALLTTSIQKAVIRCRMDSRRDVRGWPRAILQ